MATNERVLVGTIVKAIKKAHPSCWVFKVVGSPFQEGGIPDLVVCVEGMFFGLEVKNPRAGESLDSARSRATVLQRVQIMRIIEAGGEAAVVCSKEEALDAIDRGLERRTW